MWEERHNSHWKSMDRWEGTKYAAEITCRGKYSMHVFMTRKFSTNSTTKKYDNCGLTLFKNRNEDTYCFPAVSLCIIT